MRLKTIFAATLVATGTLTLTQAVQAAGETVGVSWSNFQEERWKTDEAAIKAFAKQKLASYKVPRRVLFFAEDELKTTGSAKIKTADLRKLAADRL